MAKNESSGASKGPARQCNLLQLYVKGVSFEAPGVPGILFGHEQPGLQFDVSSTYILSAEASANPPAMRLSDLTSKSSRSTQTPRLRPRGSTTEP